MPVKVLRWMKPVRNVIKICVPHSSTSMGSPQIQLSILFINAANTSMYPIPSSLFFSFGQEKALTPILFG